MLEWGALDRPFKAIKIWLAEKIGFSSTQRQSTPHENIDTAVGMPTSLLFKIPMGANFSRLMATKLEVRRYFFPRDRQRRQDNLFARCCTTMPSWRSRRINVKPCGSGI